MLVTLQQTLENNSSSIINLNPLSLILHSFIKYKKANYLHKSPLLIIPLVITIF
jgi:hypothetical protein